MPVRTHLHINFLLYSLEIYNGNLSLGYDNYNENLSLRYGIYNENLYDILVHDIFENMMLQKLVGDMNMVNLLNTIHSSDHFDLRCSDL